MRRSDFVAASESGRRRATRFFIALLMDRKDGGPTRLGITVTRKVGGAVRRNRIKRLAREWFRSRSREFGSCDLVLIAKRDIPPSRLGDPDLVVVEEAFIHVIQAEEKGQKEKCNGGEPGEPVQE